MKATSLLAVCFRACGYAKVGRATSPHLGSSRLRICKSTGGNWGYRDTDRRVTVEGQEVKTGRVCGAGAVKPFAGRTDPAGDRNCEAL